MKTEFHVMSCSKTPKFQYFLPPPPRPDVITLEEPGSALKIPNESNYANISGKYTD